MKARNLISLLGLALALGSIFFLVTNETARAARSTSTRIVAETPTATRVLMIGDSLSVGAFGEAVQLHLAKKFGAQNVSAFASCGSSPEHWLQSESNFFTKCGYREVTPDRPPVMRDFVNGRHPRPTITPKLESLVRRYRPTLIVVQLGTNWMDRNMSDREMSSIIDRFVAAGRGGSSLRKVIWIEPPDSSAMKRSAQNRVHTLIKSAAQRDNFEVIDSRLLTRYVRGKTGGDGVHYNSEASLAWAMRVNSAIDARLRPRVASR